MDDRIYLLYKGFCWGSGVVVSADEATDWIEDEYLFTQYETVQQCVMMVKWLQK